MFYQKRWNFGFSTISSLIAAYFIFLYSKGKGWTLLAFLSKWYLIIVGGLIALSFGIIFLIILFFLLMLLIAAFKLGIPNKNYKNKKNKEYIGAEYKVKE